MASFAAAPAPELRVVEYGELRRDPALADLLGIATEHLRSLAEHPYARPDDVAFLLLVREGRRVARFGLLPGRLRIGRQILPVAWGSVFDYDGDPSHRPHAGLLFLRALERAGSYCGAGPSALFQPLLVAAGLRLVPVHRYVAVMRSGAYLRRLSRLIPPVASLLVDSVLRIERGIRLSGTPSVELVPVDRFDARIRQFEESRGTCAFYRDDLELNWVLSRPWVSADHRYLPFAVHEGGGFVGFALARVKRLQDHVVATVLRTGLGADRVELTRGLILALLRRLSNADVVELYTNQRHMAEAAGALGMRRRGAIQITAKFSPSVAVALRDSGCALDTMPLEFGEGDVVFA